MLPFILKAMLLSSGHCTVNLVKIFVLQRDLNQMIKIKRERYLTMTSGLQLSSGFTLIELMISVAILAIMVSVGIPAMNGFINSNRLTAQSNEFLSAIQFARSEAIRLNRNILFCNSSDASSCNINSGNWRAWLVLDAASNTVLRTSVVAHDGLSVLSDAGISEDTVIFNAMGLARNSNNIRLAQAGVIRVCAPNASEPNFRDVVFRSGGQVEVVRPAAGNGACARPNSP